MKQMDTLLFQQSQSIDEIKNRLNCIESGSCDGISTSNGINTSNNGTSNGNSDSIKQALVSDPEFVNGIVDSIMNNSNLSEIIEQIDVVQTENRELRELLYAQQKTINEMNIMLLKMFAQNHSPVTTIVGANVATVATNGASGDADAVDDDAADDVEAAVDDAADAIALEISE
jgi:hypothetical protein